MFVPKFVSSIGSKSVGFQEALESGLVNEPFPSIQRVTRWYLSDILSGRNRQKTVRIDVSAVVPHLKMEVRPRRITGAAHIANHSAFINAFAAGYTDLALVTVQRLVAISVVDDGNISISPVIPTGIDDHAVVGGIDSIPHRSGKINGRVIGIWRVIKA